MESEISNSYSLLFTDYFLENYFEIFGENILEYESIKELNPLKEEIYLTIDRLSSSPKIYRGLDVSGIFRRIPINPFVILYRVDYKNHIVKLLTIYHSHMEISNITNELMNSSSDATKVANALRKVNPDIQAEQLRQTYKELGGDYDEATRQYLAEQARRSSMSDVDIIIEDICRR